MSRATKQKPKMWGPGIVGFGSYHYVYESGRDGAPKSAKPWPYAFITLARFNLEWLTDGRDTSAPAAQR